MENTRDKILKAATEIFAQEGFKAATVRRICKKAGVNVAAVNYYFNDKKGLYSKVIEEFFAERFKKYPPDMGLENISDPEKKLRTFIKTFFLRFTLTGNDYSEKLWLKELAEPSFALEHVVKKYILPNYEVAISIVSELLGEDATPENVEKCTFSVMGQCIHHGICRSVIMRLAKAYLPDEKRIEELIEHITAFSLGGIYEIRKKNQSK